MEGNKPRISWGTSSVKLEGAPDVSEYYTWDMGIPTEFTTRTVHTNTPLEQLGYWHMRELYHVNLLYIKDVAETQDGVFSVCEENYDSKPLSDILLNRISSKDFGDYIMQLCDALAFLHEQEARLSHNAICSENILIGKDNLLKLSCFDNMTAGESPKNDILMVGKLMASVNGAYTKNYTEIIDNCLNGAYEQISELRDDFMSASPIPWISRAITLVVVVLMFSLIVLRRVLQ